MAPAIDPDPEGIEDLQHGMDIFDQGDVLQTNGLVCKNTRGEHRERGILVARDPMLSAKALTAMDNEA